MSSEETADEFLRVAVARGCYDYDTLVGDCVDHLAGEGDPETIRAQAARLAGVHLAAHRETQTAWPARTDSDRLTDAFRALDLAGIVAREDFACCQNCGVAEIGGEGAGRGYAFYHQQDAENAVDSGDLRIAFGLFGAPPTAEIGAEVAAALRAEGLDVYWNGSPNERVGIRLRWSRRRHGRMAGYPGHPEPDGPPSLDVSYESLPNGTQQDPIGMTLPETLDVLRRLPTRTESWLSAVGRSGGIVQMRWENGRLWLETPDTEAQASIGRHASLAEAEQMLTVLSTEDRVAIRDLPGVITEPW
ncbi:hypothetical protein FB565_001164 [Actinoplanes lutulentus]|uniref:DUF6891 domain-containing protein n=1 Tax=Actinoplanes lutulentus TaxID=1287878 RepID=A0A327ZCB5_9ACTN|nr:hypothetical protein [Actinoplanes lutulentus]MBB2941460.1 hypothetical protein [Actinoplanes lutulentus]RAK36951.1 hypothetical protein B0I29_107213 [Actinoplanes lutulentus]